MPRAAPSAARRHLFDTRPRHRPFRWRGRYLRGSCANPTGRAQKAAPAQAGGPSRDRSRRHPRSPHEGTGHTGAHRQHALTPSDEPAPAAGRRPPGGVLHSRLQSAMPQRRSAPSWSPPYTERLPIWAYTSSRGIQSRNFSTCMSQKRHSWPKPTTSSHVTSAPSSTK